MKNVINLIVGVICMTVGLSLHQAGAPGYALIEFILAGINFGVVIIGNSEKER